MRIYKVTFNDGGWYSGDRPTFTVVANSESEAVQKVISENPNYKSGWNAWAVEFKIEGYVIEVYDEKSYKRIKNLENLDI